MDLLHEQKPKIVKAEDSEKLARKALSLFIDSACKAIDARGVFYVAISGGHTPAIFYELLSEESAYSRIDWRKVHLFWVDERCVPPSAEASNFGLAAHTFLLDVPIPGENVHRVTGEDTNYAQAAEEYEKVILNVFGLKPGKVPRFDLVLLGMGADGHIGSVLPNTNALFHTNSLVTAVYRMDAGFSRITLTVPVFKEAQEILILVSGQAKAEIVRDVFRSEPDEFKYPVHFLWPIVNKVTWIMDQHAAALL